MRRQPSNHTTEMEIAKKKTSITRDVLKRQPPTQHGYRDYYRASKLIRKNGFTDEAKNILWALWNNIDDGTDYTGNETSTARATAADWIMGKITMATAAPTDSRVRLMATAAPTGARVRLMATAAPTDSTAALGDYSDPYGLYSGS